MVVQRVAPERIEQELARADERCDPPLPVWAWLIPHGRESAGVLLGWWASCGSHASRRGLVLVTRDAGEGCRVEELIWVHADHIRRRNL